MLFRSIGIAIDTLFGPKVKGFWTRLLLVTIAMTPFVTLLVFFLNASLFGRPPSPRALPGLTWRVFVIALLVMAVRALAWRRVVETHTLVIPPMPDAERDFRLRLSAKRRGARLIALEAEDHFVRVHTDAGSELLSMRFSDAMAELKRAHGIQLHRSWWAAGDAIESVRWRRGEGEAQLVNELSVPISRNFAKEVKAAGWR